MIPRNFYTSKHWHTLYQRGCYGHEARKLGNIPPESMFYFVQETKSGLLLVVYQDIVGVIQPLYQGRMRLVVEEEET